jgi:hypothetical protein
MTTELPNGRKIFQNGNKIYEHFSFQGPPKYTRLGSLCMKKYHLTSDNPVPDCSRFYTGNSVKAKTIN